MTSSGIPGNQAQQISAAHGLKGPYARDFIAAHKAEIGEITRGQQINLFNLIYPSYITRAIGNYNNWTSDEPGRYNWESLDPII